MTEGEVIEVMPCPFCGAVTALACELDTPDAAQAAFAVVCEACSAQGPAASSFEDANEAWKQRDDAVEALTLDDEDLEDELLRRPEVLQRMFAGALLARAVGELVEAGVSKADVAKMIRAGMAIMPPDDEADDDDEADG